MHKSISDLTFLLSRHKEMKNSREQPLPLFLSAENPTQMPNHCLLSSISPFIYKGKSIGVTQPMALLHLPSPLLSHLSHVSRCSQNIPCTVHVSRA